MLGGIPESYFVTVRDCPKCKTKQFAVHTCPDEREVIDPIAWNEVARNNDNPLDRLSLADYFTIMQGEEEAKKEFSRMDSAFKEREAAYFKKALTYRVEFEPLPTAPGFRPQVSGLAIQVEGHEEADWLAALSFLNAGHALASTIVKKGEAHQCRLVSYGGDNGKMKYLWGVKKLAFMDGIGWDFSDWSEG